MTDRWYKLAERAVVALERIADRDIKPTKKAPQKAKPPAPKLTSAERRSFVRGKLKRAGAYER